MHVDTGFILGAIKFMTVVMGLIVIAIFRRLFIMTVACCILILIHVEVIGFDNTFLFLQQVKVVWFGCSKRCRSKDRTRREQPVGL